MNRIKHNIKYWILGIIVSTGYFIMFGIVTVLIPNSFFVRMTPITSLDYIFLLSSSLPLGAYTGVHYYKKNNVQKCNVAVATGGIGSFLAFACPVCNKLLVFLFGATALMTYFEPYRPILGFVSNGLLAGAVWWRLKQ